MARYDKYDPISGGTRAKLAANLPLVNGAIGPVGVSLNASGLVVIGTAGQSGLIGVLVKNAPRGPIGQWNGTMLGDPVPHAFIGTEAGDVVDIMTNGEIVDIDPAVFTAGQKVYTNAAGALSVTGGAGKTQVGFTVEAGRLVVRVAAGAVAAV